MDQANSLRSILDTKNKFKQNLSSRVITVTSGKGGVGKTNFTVNLALSLQKHNARVLILDADLGLANIEILLGVSPKLGLMDIFTSNYKINEVVSSSSYGVNFISGGSGLSELANLRQSHLRHIIESLVYLDDIADIILIDTGAGISDTVLNFVKASQEVIVITAPEPTSITDAYSLIKTAKEQMSSSTKFSVVVNRTENKSEGEVVFRNLSKVSQRFLDIQLLYLGAIPHDNNLIKSVKQQKPAIVLYPNSSFSKEIENIATRILNKNNEIKANDQIGGMKGFVKRLAGIVK